LFEIVSVAGVAGPVGAAQEASAEVDRLDAYVARRPSTGSGRTDLVESAMVRNVGVSGTTAFGLKS
jgi:hypothetical protein